MWSNIPSPPPPPTNSTTRGCTPRPAARVFRLAWRAEEPSLGWVGACTKGETLNSCERKRAATWITPSLPFYATLVSYFKPAAAIDSFARRGKKASRAWLVGCAERRWRVYRAIAACLAPVPDRYRSGGCCGDGVVRSADAKRLFLIYIQTRSPAALRAAPSEKDKTSGSFTTLALPLVCPPPAQPVPLPCSDRTHFGQLF